MNKNFKGVIIFGTGIIGGVGLCGWFVIRRILTTDDLRGFLSKKISKKIEDSIYSYSNTDKKDSSDQFIFESRDKAERVLKDMKYIIDKYGFVTEADLHDLCDRPSCSTDNTYGWVNLNKARIIRIKEGYMLRLPVAKELW